MFKSKLKSRLFTKVPIRPTKTGGSFVSVFRFFSFDLYLLECAHICANTAALFSSTKLHLCATVCVKWPFTVGTYERSIRHTYWIKLVPIHLLSYSLCTAQLQVRLQLNGVTSYSCTLVRIQVIETLDSQVLALFLQALYQKLHL